jgi:hypothetical protein
MPTKNDDDVAHLLEATGGPSSSYREFDNPSDHVHAPLIDAVFAQGPPDPAPEDQRPLIGATTTSDLLGEVFDPPKHVSQPETRRPVGPARLATEADAAPRASSPPASPTASGRRSLSDIRRIITRPSEEVPKASPTDSLHGLFDRLAG